MPLTQSEQSWDLSPDGTETLKPDSWTDAQLVACNDWFIEAIGQGPAITRLGRENKRGPGTHLGNFYVRFRIHVTRP